MALASRLHWRVILLFCLAIVLFPVVNACTVLLDNHIYVANVSTTLCPGTYTRSLIQINNDSITIDCDGAVLDGLLQSNGETAITVNANMDNTTVTGCTITRFNRGYYTSHTDFTTPDYIINTTFHNNTRGVEDTFNYYLQVRNSTFTWNTYGIYEASADYYNITTNRFFNNSIAGIYFASSQSIRYSRVVGNTFSGERSTSGSQIYLDAQINGLLISDNVFNNSYKSAIGTGSSLIKQQVTIRDNVAEHINETGFEIFNLRNSTIENNRIYDTSGHGIIFQTTDSYNITIADNEIRNGRQTGYAGIYILFTFINSTIAHNTVVNYSVPITINSGWPVNNTIFDNIFVTRVSNPLNFNATDRFNTTKDCGSTNIKGGPCIGGNYWGTVNGTGFSDTCADVDEDGFCDSAYSLSGVDDYLPLSSTSFFDLLSGHVQNISSSAIITGAISTYSRIEGVATTFDMQGANTSEMNLTTKVQTGWWQGVWGNVFVNFSLVDPAGETFYSWGIDTVNASSKLFFSNDSVYFNCSQVEATAAQAGFSQSTYGWADSTSVDNLTVTYSSSANHQPFDINSCGQQITDAPALNLQDGLFNATMLWDQNEGRPLFVTLLTPGGTAYNGRSADFEILLPTRSDGGIETYYLYGEFV